MVDRPGYGYSDFGKIETNIHRQAAFMETIVDSLHLQNFNLLGTSYGGPVAVIMASHLSDKITKLILFSASVKPKAEKTYWISHPMTTPVFQYFFPAIFRMSSLEKFSHAAELNSLAGWQKIACPTYIIHGDKDPLIYFENALYLKEKIPHAQLLKLKDKGHSLIFSEPDYYKQIIHQVMAE